jgi:hypothetical protein
MRATRALRGLVREMHLDPADFVYPMFIAHRREPIATMPGIERLTIDVAVQEAGEAASPRPRTRRAREPGTTRASSSWPRGRSRKPIPG